MSFGPGKYDKETTLVQKLTGGSVIVIVVGGDRGEGFSVQATADVLWTLPDMLREIAKQMEADTPKMEITP